MDAASCRCLDTWEWFVRSRSRELAGIHPREETSGAFAEMFAQIPAVFKPFVQFNQLHSFSSTQRQLVTTACIKIVYTELAVP